MKIMDFVETNSNISYKDMQPISFYKNYIPTKDNVAFLNILQRYEKLEKTKVSVLSERISALKELNESLLNSDIYLSGIKKGIIKKQNHLASLLHLFELGVLRDRKEIYNPEIEELFRVDNQELLPLKNDLIYDFNENVLLGKYIIEVVDPAHRFTVLKYIDEWQQTSKQIPFFMYLEQKCNYDLIPEIQYFSDSKLKSCEIYIKNGLLYQSNGNLLSTDMHKEYLFILTKDNIMYGCYGNRNVKHTSLSIGDAIKCGGALKVNNGKVQEINLDSGHYFPSLAHLNKLVYYLRKKGVLLENCIPVTYHENYMKKSILLKQGQER